MRVVLDTNVIVAAIFFGGKPRFILEQAIEGAIKICTSEAMLTELEGVLRRPKFDLDPRIVQNVIGELMAMAEWIIPSKKHQVVADDPEDNMLVDCAVEADADYIVTGDAHLLGLQRFGNFEIVTPGDFITLLPARGHIRT